MSAFLLSISEKTSQKELRVNLRDYLIFRLYTEVSINPLFTGKKILEA